MATAFGILLFVLVYGYVAYIVYDDVTGGRSRLERSSRHRVSTQPQLRSN